MAVLPCTPAVCAPGGRAQKVGVCRPFEIIAIPGGRISMGSSLCENGRGDDEGPRHRVVIRPFWMGKTEVTWDEYNEFRQRGLLSLNDRLA
jgi:formylglycine-generating enzyme required for sulfatase activity